MDRTIKVRLGQVVRELRKQRGLTQAALGKAVGVTVSQISNIEVGHTPPSLDTLTRIARALRARLPEFFAFDTVGGSAGGSERRAKILALTKTMTPGELALGLALLEVIVRGRRRPRL